MSAPPKGWINAGHRHGSKVLGTFIFEHQAGKDDMQALLLPIAHQQASRLLLQPYRETNPFREITTFYADRLVDLAILRGFDGWLINVEVPLGLDPEDQERAQAQRHRQPAKRPFATEHAWALKAWLSYLGSECKRRIGSHASVVWYDATTIKGELSWQCHLNVLNAPLAHECDSIFLDYHWKAKFPQRSNDNLIRLRQRRHNLQRTPGQEILKEDLTSRDILVGIDVFGRGQYGGGQFLSFKAFENVKALQQPQSTALFGFGWLSEGAELGLARSAARVFDTERFFYTGGQPTQDVMTWREALIEKRREEHDKQLAYKLQSGQLEDLPEEPPQDPDWGVPTVDLLKPLARFLPSQPPPPSHLLGGQGFFSNFAQGAGSSFFIRGRRVFDAPWTNLDCLYSQPDLIYPCCPEGVEAKLDASKAWEGNVSLSIEADRDSVLPLFTVSLPARSWKAKCFVQLLEGDPPQVCVQDSNDQWSSSTWPEARSGERLTTGTWVAAECHFEEATPASKLGLRLEGGSRLRLGSLALTETDDACPFLEEGPCPLRWHR